MIKRCRKTVLVGLSYFVSLHLKHLQKPIIIKNSQIVLGFRRILLKFEMKFHSRLRNTFLSFAPRGKLLELVGDFYISEHPTSKTRSSQSYLQVKQNIFKANFVFFREAQ